MYVVYRVDISLKLPQISGDFMSGLIVLYPYYNKQDNWHEGAAVVDVTQYLRTNLQNIFKRFKVELGPKNKKQQV